MLFHALMLAALTVQPAEGGTSPLEGRWTNPSGSLVIVIAPCAAAMCGSVQSASDKATNDARKAGTDPLVGALLLTGIVPKGRRHWQARLFVPDLKKTTKADLRLLSSDSLQVKGCTVGGII